MSTINVHVQLQLLDTRQRMCDERYLQEFMVAPADGQIWKNVTQRFDVRHDEI